MSDPNKLEHPRIAICVATTGIVPIEFATSLAELLAYAAKVPLGPEIKDQELRLLVIAGSSILSSYDKLVRTALEWPATHVLFLEHDMQFPPTALHTLYSHHQMWVGANYRVRVPPFWFTAVSLDKTRRIETTEQSRGLEPCAYTGFGLCLLDAQLFQKLDRPWFSHPFLGEIYGTQDWHLSVLAERVGVTPFVDHDLSKAVRHVGTLPVGISGPPSEVLSQPQAPTVTTAASQPTSS